MIDSIHTVLHQVLEMAVEDSYMRNNPSDNALKELKKTQLYLCDGFVQFPDYNESILRFEEYLLKEGCYGNLFRHSELSQRG